MTDTTIEPRDEAVAEALVAGQSVRSVQKQFGLTTAELDAALERLWPIDTAARLRTIKTDLGQLNRLTQVFYEKALAGDVPAGTVTVKLWERKHQLLGLDAVQRIDLQIITPPKAVPRHEKIREAIMRLTEQPPVRRAAIERIDQLGPEKALALLNSGTSNGQQPSDGDASPPAGP